MIHRTSSDWGRDGKKRETQTSFLPREEAESNVHLINKQPNKHILIPLADPGGPGPPCPQNFSKIMQFSGNLKGKPLFRLRAPLWGQNSTGPPDQNPGSAPAFPPRKKTHTLWDTALPFATHIATDHTHTHTHTHKRHDPVKQFFFILCVCQFYFVCFSLRPHLHKMQK